MTLICDKLLKVDTEKSRSWSSAHDWKSCNRYKRFESSNLSFSAKMKGRQKASFFILTEKYNRDSKQRRKGSGGAFSSGDAKKFSKHNKREFEGFENFKKIKSPVPFTQRDGTRYTQRSSRFRFSSLQLSSYCRYYVSRKGGESERVVYFAYLLVIGIGIFIYYILYLI